jgi:8-oxo-dGTP pyrophosphatase MutT (NUDIX family)
MDNPYQLLSSTEVYRNPWIRVREDRVQQEGGAPREFGVVDMKSGSSTLAVMPDHSVILVREFKYAVGRPSLEVISGAIEEGEQPLEAARRELVEEAGLIAREWIGMGAIDPFTTVVNSPNYLFLALRAEQRAQAAPDPGEILHSVRLPFREALEQMIQGEITHGASCVLLLKAERYFRDVWPGIL